MKYVFLDNFRGFKNTLLPILDVNFLVGENSTGKTSILNIVKLLSSRDIWLSSDFSLREVGISSYRDAVSAESPDKSSFSVGAIFLENQNDQANSGALQLTGFRPTGSWLIVLTFSEREGMPSLKSVVSIKNGVQVNLKYGKNKVLYKVFENNELACCQELVARDIKKYSDLWKNDGRGYKKLDGFGGYSALLPAFVVLAQIEVIHKNSKEGGEGAPTLGFPVLAEDIAWIAPIRSKPRKTYDEHSLDFSPEGDHTPYLLRKQLDSRSGSEKFRKSMESFGKDSGLFKSVQIKKYGKGASEPFELDVVLARAPLSVDSVGYGVSQALPVVVELFARRGGAWFAIQQPEVHLHPRAQASFGEVVYNLACLEKKKFFVETHSDYLIDRFRVVARKEKKEVSSQILYFERSGKGNTVFPIGIDVEGRMPSDQPKGYREFFIKEEMKILEI